MVTVGALEAIRTGTTTIVENSGGISRHAAALAKTGLRCVFVESVRDSENVAGPMSPAGLAKSEPPRFSPKLRAEGLQRINDLFTRWHGANQGRIRRDDAFPGVQPQPEDILADATQGGARAVRQGQVLGVLEVGKKADLLVVDTLRAHLVPAGRIVSAWIHNGQPSDIESVMVDGQFITRNRKVLTMDEDSIMRKPTRSGGGFGSGAGSRSYHGAASLAPAVITRR